MITSASQSALRRPQLAPSAPVIPRPGSQFQVGLDPRTALVFTGAGFGELLGCLDGHHSVDDLEAAGWAAGLSTRRGLRWRCTGCARPDCCTGPDPDRNRRDHRIRLIGAGPVGLAVARQLVDRGIAALYVFDAARPIRLNTPPRGCYPTGRRAVLARRRPRPGDRADSPTGPSPRRLPIDLTVVVADGPEVDRVITDHLLRVDQPHLVVRSLGDAAWVGPLVLPGRTSCLRCADLSRRDADPHWPLVLAQLSRMRLDLPARAGRLGGVGRRRAGAGLPRWRAARDGRCHARAVGAPIRDRTARLAGSCRLRMRLGQPHQNGRRDRRATA